MHRRKTKRSRKTISLLCALVLVAGLGLPAAGLSRAFAGDEETDAPLEVSDKAYEGKTAANAEVATVEEQTSTEAEQQASEGTEEGVAPGAEEPAVDEGPSDVAENPIESTGGASASDTLSETPEGSASDAEVGSDEGGNADRAADAQAKAEAEGDNASSAEEESTTVYFGGDQVTTLKVKPGDMIGQEHVPAMPQTKTIELLGQPVQATFLGWTRVFFADDGTPLWGGKGDTDFGEGFADRWIWFQPSFGGVVHPLTNEELAQKTVSGDYWAYQPVYEANMTYIKLTACIPEVENGVFDGANFKNCSEEKRVWVPANHSISPSAMEEATTETFKDANEAFMKAPYKYTGWYKSSNGSTGLSWRAQEPLTFSGEHCTRIYALFSTNPAAYWTEGDDEGDNASGEEGSSKFIVLGNDTGVTVGGTPAGPNIPEGANVILFVNLVTSGSAYDTLIGAMGDGKLAGVFEIDLNVNGMQIHDGFGKLEISFPVEGADGHWVTVYHLHQDGTVTSQRVVAKDGKVTITVTDLSTFALEVGEAYRETPTTPTKANASQGKSDGKPSSDKTAALAQTGDLVLVAPVVIVALASLVLAVFAGGRMRRCRGRHVR